MDGPNSESPGKTIKSVETAFRILDVVLEHEEVGVTELAEVLGRSKSTVHHYLKTLEREGCLERDGGRYRLGLRFLTFGGRARAQETLYRLARSDVDRLADETGEVVRLVVERHGRGITLYQAAGDETTAPHTYVGSIEQLHCTAAGKAFLAELPPERSEEIVDGLDLAAYTSKTITEREALREELERIRSRGVAFDDEERFAGVRCVAAPITSGTGDLLGAISVSGPKARLRGERFRTDIPNQLQNVVGVVEVNSTYLEWSEG